jgi:uncharacterized membrane protein
LIGLRIARSNLNYQALAQVEVQTPADVVYRQVAILENWRRWSPFIPQHAANVILDDASPQPNLQWEDPRGGTAVLWLTATDSVSGSVRHELQSPIFPKLEGQLKVTPTSPTTSRVEWTVQGTLPNTIFYRLMSETYGESLGGQLQQALQRLKTQLESTQE